MIRLDFDAGNLGPFCQRTDCIEHIFGLSSKFTKVKKKFDLQEQKNMAPDFSSKTRDRLAKRAHFICSNPDCGDQTVGPNEQDDKVTLIGEAAHISGARETSARFDANSDDFKRAEITNGIWLCRNCHKLIDDDPLLAGSIACVGGQITF